MPLKQFKQLNWPFFKEYVMCLYNILLLSQNQVPNSLKLSKVAFTLFSCERSNIVLASEFGT